MMHPFLLDYSYITATSALTGVAMMYVTAVLHIAPSCLIPSPQRSMEMGLWFSWLWPCSQCC